MITVIIIFQAKKSLLSGYPQLPCQQIDIRTHLTAQFLFRDAAKRGISLVHADVLNIVQLAEYAQL